jgi:hypothetical protein
VCGILTLAGRFAALYTNMANNVIEKIEREIWMQYFTNVAAAGARSPGKHVAVDMSGKKNFSNRFEIRKESMNAHVSM